MVQIMIIDYKLVYPSGTATGILINSFHTPGGVVVAKCALYSLLFSQRNFVFLVVDFGAQ
jgi:hypothetical protein